MPSLTSCLRVSATISLATLALSTQVPAPVLTHAFSVQVDLGTPVGPIPTAGQLTIVEPITGGNITGPLFSGTIAAGGASVIDFNSNFTVASPAVEIWGKTDDGNAFFVRGYGVGKQGEQSARLIISVSGKYAALEDEFVLASFTDNAANPPTISTIEAWVVSRG